MRSKDASDEVFPVEREKILFPFCRVPMSLLMKYLKLRTILAIHVHDKLSEAGISAEKC